MLELFLIFAIGSVSGWILEFFARWFLNQRKLINPGFLNGPYLPIYGGGLLTFYFIFSTPLNFFLQLILFGIAATILELIIGIIFIHKLKVKLWDYNDELWNYKGVICPIYTVYWMILGALFYFVAYTPFTKFLYSLISNNIALLLLGSFYGIFFVDLVSSFRFVTKIKNAMTGLKLPKLIDYRFFKLYINTLSKQNKVLELIKQFLPTEKVIKKDMILKYIQNFRKKNS